MKTISLLSIVLLTACGPKPGTDEVTDSGETSTDSGETSTETGDTEVEIAPEDGNYLAQLVAFTTDECEMEAEEWATILEDDIAMAFARNGSDLTMDLLTEGEVDESRSCMMMDDHFMCEILRETNDVGGPDLDASMTVSMGVAVGWQTNTDIAGSLNLNIACEGVDCIQAMEEEGMPSNSECLTSVSFEGSKID
jgi:hypothetical protein